jgi:hypothetical protein
MASLSIPPPLAIATQISLRGQRRAETQAADSAERAMIAGTAPRQQTGRALIEAVQASPDALRAITDLHQARRAYRANAEDGMALRGADARSAALLRWSF